MPRGITGVQPHGDMGYSPCLPGELLELAGSISTAREIVPARGGLVQKNGEHSKPYYSLSSVSVTTL